MTSQIFLVSAVTQTLNLTSIRVLYGKVALANKFSLSLKIFIVKRNKIQLDFDNIYSILKIIKVCQNNIKHGKNCTDESFYFLYSVISVGKIMLHILLRNVWRAGLQSLRVSVSTDDRRNASATLLREVGYFFPRRRRN